MTPEQIAAELSEAQRQTMLGKKRVAWWTVQSLKKLGIVDSIPAPPALQDRGIHELFPYTETGLAVRAILEKTDG